MTNPSALQEEITTLISVLNNAQTELARGNMPDLTNFDTRIRDLCLRIEQASQEEKATIKQSLENLLSRINSAGDNFKLWKERHAR